ncbi:MAG: hypothetical protein KAJ86_07455 [Alphaproteobacteria bacterium]|nr:hypothetical protein [Alphaproteobacteria bacterium]
MKDKIPENTELPLSLLTLDVTRYDKYLADCDLTVIAVSMTMFPFYFLILKQSNF